MASLQMSIEMDGERELLAKLDKLNVAVRDRIAFDAVRAGAAILVPQVRARAPVKTGGLASSVDMAARNYRQSGVAMAFVGPSYPRGRHGAIIERGTKQRQTSRGLNRGRVQPDPFVDPVFQANRDIVLGVMAGHIKSAIEAEVS